MKSHRAFKISLMLAILPLIVHAGEGPSLAWTRMGQSGAGLAMGIAGAYLGAAAGKSIDPCNEKADGNDALDLCNSSGTSIGAASGYLIGTTTGIYGTGRLFGREGSPWMTASGASLGLLAGALLSSQIDGNPVLQVMSLLAFSQGMALFGYHWTDRVRVTAALETIPRKWPAGTSNQPSLALRPQVEVILAIEEIIPGMAGLRRQM